MSQNEPARKGWNEVFAQFFENPTRSTLRTLLRENLGEFNHIDFKKMWLLDAALARHLLGFANSGGGVIVIGVREEDDKNLAPDGLETLADKTDISNSVKRFLPDTLQYSVLNFRFDESEYAKIKGKQFQVLLIENAPEHLPFVCQADGDKIRKAAIYVRDGVATIEASHEQLQRILNTRIATSHSTDRELTLKDHLDELQILYAMIPRQVGGLFGLQPIGLSTPNPSYPKEHLDSFVARMIEAKKKVIEEFLMKGANSIRLA
jgi:predicted HTH transcriptional regulator